MAEEVRQELVIDAKANVADAQAGLAALDGSVDASAKSVDGLSDALGELPPATTAAAKGTEQLGDALGDIPPAAGKAKSETDKAGSGFEGMGKGADKARLANERLARESARTAEAVARQAAAETAAAASAVKLAQAQVALEVKQTAAALAAIRLSEAQEKAADKLSESSVQAAAGAPKVEKFKDVLDDLKRGAEGAADSFVSKLGPGMTKGLAVGAVAIAGVTAAAHLFTESAEQMFKQWGPSGIAVWDQVEQSLFRIKGSFAQAVLGGGDMYETGARLQVTFRALGDVVAGVLSPVRLLAGAFGAVVGAVTDLDDEVDAAAEALRDKVEADKSGAAAASLHGAAMRAEGGDASGLREQIQRLAYSERELEAMRLARVKAQINASRAQIEETIAARTATAEQNKYAAALNAVEEARQAELASTQRMFLSVTQQREAVAKINQTFEQRVSTIQAMAAADAGAAASSDTVAQATFAEQQALDELSRAAESVDAQLYDLTKTSAGLTEQTARQTQQTKAATSAEDGLADAMRRVADATRAAAEAQRGLAEFRQEKHKGQVEEAAAAGADLAARIGANSQNIAQQQADAIDAAAASSAQAMDNLSKGAIATMQQAFTGLATSSGEAFGAMLAGASEAESGMDSLGPKLIASTARSFAALFGAVGAGMLLLPGSQGLGLGLLGASAALSVLAGAAGYAGSGATGATRGAGASGRDGGSRASAGSGGAKVTGGTMASVLVNLGGATIISDDPRTTRGLLGRLGTAESMGGNGP